MEKRGFKKRAVVFCLYLLPFMFNIAIVEFLMPVKYDVILDNLPFMGLLITIAWLFSTLFDFAIGDLTDKIGIRKTIQIGILLGFLGSLLFGLSQNFLIMSLGILLWGFSFTLLAIPSETFILSRFNKKHVGDAYGIYFFFYDLAYALAPLIALVLVYFFNINTAIIAAAFFIILSFPLSFFIPSKPKEGIEQAMQDIALKDGIVKKEWKDILKMNKQELSILLNMFVCEFWFTIVLMGAPLLFFHEAGDLKDGAILAFAFMLPFGIVGLFSGKIADSEKARMKMIKYGFFIAGLLLVLFYFVQSFIILLLLGVTIAISTNFAWTASEVHISEYLPKGKKGEYMGIFTAAKDIGFDIAPLFYGLTAVFGLKVPFLVLGLLIICTGLFFAIAFRKNYEPKQ